MSQLALLTLSAVIGALAALVTSFYRSLKSEYELRSSQILEIKTDFETAKTLIRAALTETQVWPAPYELTTNAWGSQGTRLFTRFTKKSWLKLRMTARQLEVVDRWAQELHENKATWDADFAKVLQKLFDKDLPEALQILDDQLTGEHGKYSLRWPVRIFVVAALVAWLAFFLSSLSGPALTSSSLETAIRAQTPDAGLTICDKSRPLEGAYTCTIGLAPCAGQLEAAVEKKPSCQSSLTEVAKVVTDGRCFSPTLLRVLVDEAPTPEPPSKFRRFLVRAGCAKG